MARPLPALARKETAAGGHTGEIGSSSARARRSLRPQALAAIVIGPARLRPEHMSLTDARGPRTSRSAVMSDDESDRAEFDLRMIEVGAQPLRVAVKRGPRGR